MPAFTLTIELGNEAMQTGEDIADALRTLCHRWELAPEIGESGAVRDTNGNTVGRWEVVSQIT